MQERGKKKKLFLPDEEPPRKKMEEKKSTPGHFCQIFVSRGRGEGNDEGKLYTCFRNQKIKG